MFPFVQMMVWGLAGIGLEKLKEEYLAKFRPKIKDTHPNLTKVLDNSFWVANALLSADAIWSLINFRKMWRSASELGKLGKKMREQKGVKNKAKGLWNQFLSVFHKGALIGQIPATPLMVYHTVQEIKEVPHFERISEELQKEEALKEAARQIEELGLSAVKMDQIINSEIMKNFYKLLEGNAEMNRALDLMLDNEELEELIYQLEDLMQSEENLYAQYLAEDLADYIREQMEMQSAYSQAVQILASMLAQGGR
jgi:hypothetical protein